MKNFYIFYGLPASGTTSVLYKFLGHKIISGRIDSDESCIIDCDSYTINTTTFLPGIMKVDYKRASGTIGIKELSAGFKHIFIDAGNQVDQYMKHLCGFVESSTENPSYNITNMFVADLKYLLLPKEKVLALRGYMKIKPNMFVGTHYDDFVMLQDVNFARHECSALGNGRYEYLHHRTAPVKKSILRNLEKSGVMQSLSFWGIDEIDYISAGQEIPADLKYLH